MHVAQPYLRRILCPATKLPMLHFYRLLSVTGPSFLHQEQSGRDTIFAEGWRPYCVYVKGLRGTQPQSEWGLAYDIITIPDGPEYDKKVLASDVIRRVSPEGASVCDPFMGKGAVGQAALRIGRTYIGIEKDTTLFLSAMTTLYEQ